MGVGRWMDENLSTQGYRLSGNERKGLPLTNLCLPSVALAWWERRHTREAIAA